MPAKGGLLGPHGPHPGPWDPALGSQGPHPGPQGPPWGGDRAMGEPVPPRFLALAREAREAHGPNI